MAQTEVSISLEPETNTDEKKGLPKGCETQTDTLRPKDIFIAVIEIIAFLAITPIIVIPVLPPMLALYYIALIVQVFRFDVDNQVGRFLGSVAKWLRVFFAVISVYLLLCMLIFGVTPSLKHRTFHGLSIARWIGVLTIICVFLTYSMLVRFYLGYYRHRRKKHSEETVHLYEGIIGAINSLFYLLALFSIIRVAPLLKEHKTLGHPTQKWVRMIILLVLGHFAVRIFTSSIVILFHNKYIIKAGKNRLRNSTNPIIKRVLQRLQDFVTLLTGKETSTDEWTKYIVYYAEGLRTSFNFVFTLFLVLLTWVLYFGSRLDRSSSHVIRAVYDLGCWTLACVLAGGILWLVKSGIILTWRARVVYDRFEKKISGAAKQLYLIGIIADPKCDILGIWKKQNEGGEDRVENKEKMTDKHHGTEQPSHGEEGKGQGESSQQSEAGSTQDNKDKKNSEIPLEVEDKTAWKILVRKKCYKEGKQRVLRDCEYPLYTSNLVRMARYFMAAEEPLSKDGFVTRIDAKLREQNSRLKEEVEFDREKYFMAGEEPLSKDDFVTRIDAKLREPNSQSKEIEELPKDKLKTDDRNLFLGQLLKDVKEEEFDKKKIEKLLKDVLKTDDRNLLSGQLVKDDNDKVTYTYIQKWIMKYHKVCLELGRTISGAMEVVNCLDNIMTGVIVVAVFIVWLLLTEHATTKVLVLIASPIVGANFIFGQSCSTLFQGIMFVYVMHPFDVGDLCTINHVQLEVKRIGVWKTSFSKVGTTDSVSYPNAALANISVDNHKVEMDPNDCVEMRVKPTAKMEQINELKSKIERYLDEEKSFKKHPYGVRLKNIGVDDLTIAVHFMHEETKIEPMLSIDGLCKKSEMREKLLVQMKKFLEELSIEKD